MIGGKTIMAIIPARGGSKGIPRKNIRLLAGKPLIAWTIEEAKKSKYIDRLILSSEDEEIIETAKKWGCEVPFVRPPELAQDNTPGIEPVIHAIKNTERKYDYVVLLQPTSPLRTVEDIDGCIEKCVQEDAQSCVSICQAEHSPYWMYILSEQGKMQKLIKAGNFTRRQDLPIVYRLNGALYVARTELILKEKSFFCDETKGYVMNPDHSVDIDTEMDFLLGELLIKRKHNNVDR
jgi:CMP-N,N'-diacetyllegionaminic acid synthase